MINKINVDGVDHEIVSESAEKKIAENKEKLDTLVVNDLTTGGADKALSAEMGKELGEELTELGSEVGIIAKNTTLPKGTILKELLKFVGKKVYFNISAVNINGALTFLDSNGAPITELIGEKNIVIPSNTAEVKVNHGDVYATILYMPYTSEVKKQQIEKLEIKTSEISSGIGIIVNNELLVKGTEIPMLIDFKSKGVYFNVQPTDINGAISFYDKNGEYLPHDVVGEKTKTIPEEAAKAVVNYGDVIATILYKDYIPSNIALELRGGKAEIEGQAVNYVEGMYVDGYYEDGSYNVYSSISTAYYEVKEGITYNIHIPHCTNAAAWMIGYTPNPDSSVKVSILKEFGKGTNNKNVDLVLNSTYTGYIALGYATDSELPTTKSIQEIPNLRDEVRRLSNLVDKGESVNRSIMFFGDSLTAASTKGIVGFAENIAKKDNVPYRAFLFDRFDTNPNKGDIDVDYPCYTNYAKDGTTNRIVSTRVDSVLERVKNHVNTTTNVDVVIVECCVNDYASTDTKGVVSDNYSGFDTSTTLGGLEETCRYLSTLNRNIVFGFIIPWNISWVSPDYFDEHIAVLKKWGVPFLDLRDSAGFEMRKCLEHRNLYSLPSSSYGDYDSSTTYNLDDKVKYNGYLYKCKENGVTGIIPTNEQYWIKVSDGSFDGTHLNTLGHYIVWNKIYDFINRL